jgi:hypothetical protein
MIGGKLVGFVANSSLKNLIVISRQTFILKVERALGKQRKRILEARK